MRIRPIVRRQARLSLLVAGVCVLAAAAPRAPGVSFVMHTSTREGSGPEHARDAMRVRVQGTSMRFDGDPARKSKDDGFDKGAYTVADMAGRRLLVIMPENRQYSWNSASTRQPRSR
jgi:hypothetical protein